jgi:hypothetical protein
VRPALRFLVLAALALAVGAPAATGAPAANAKPAAKASPAATPAPVVNAAPAAVPPPCDIDRESEPIVRALNDAMGGQKTWDNLPCFRFDFVVVRDGKEAARFSHWWDKWHGRCRVEGKDDHGKMVTAIFGLADKKGTVFVDGIGESDPVKVAAAIQNGYERWVNDTYWVMMPFKLHDNGVRIRYSRPERTLQAKYDVLEVTFVPGTGLTSDDHYWLYVNRSTHLIDKWEFVLTGQKPPPSGSTWEGWTNIGPIKLSLERRIPGKPVMLRFENVSIPQKFDESVFTYSAVKK